jgi:regulator of protease activity HflC (stomatin/prohibitin superfamily)
MGKKEMTRVVIGIIILLVILIFNPFVIVRAGERGVVLNWGAVSDIIYNEGLHLKIPIYQKIEKMDVTVQKEEYPASAASKDLQIVSTKVTINYRLIPSHVNWIYQNLKRDHSARVIIPTIQEYVKKTTARYTAEELITRREEVKDDLRIALSDNLAKSYIEVRDIFITDFNFSDEFNKAIEAKVTAEQRALEQKNILEQVKYKAEQRITAAKAEAEAIRIQAQAITQQGGKDYVQLKAIEKWDGKLPVQMIPGATVPFINVSPQR